ncbi:MAG: [LysW]-aminoadipate/[LysW]-glutamate kinase [Candidatus Bathyarchaeota archaeon]|nr:[LysW]-aminoadipate/[LysW]-glutamate kinase [Candidatus Bathyarchaeota archaeon]MDH5636352.1 [LysW]-aminoadipate/[LysW]-glutamate kinase [Candidatus Bathyarchaeota archaeon]MDH5701299.1 [LysW]-aminoadipate/[LysW]-glutamate kinase [Candidatus Bathyarchaeota archaeon]
MLIVVKIGGSILKGVSSELVSDIKNVLSKNQIVLVHGGGKEVTEIASKLGKKQEFVVSPNGFRSRYTDKETIEIFAMVMAGKINKQIVSTLQSQGISALGLSGLDGFLVQAKRKKRLVIVDERGRKRVVDGGYTGKISEVNASLLQLLLENGYVPVIAPIAISEEFEPLNVDGDRTAAYIAGALNADRLILLTDVEGLILDDKLVSKLSFSEVEGVLPKIGRGMITKVYAAVEALNLDVGEVLISYGLERLPISSSLKHECGTVISRE